MTIVYPLQQLLFPLFKIQKIHWTFNIFHSLFGNRRINLYYFKKSQNITIIHNYITKNNNNFLQGNKFFQLSPNSLPLFFQNKLPNSTMQFSHLHCHTQFSLLDGAANIAGMIAKAKADNMRAVALTDHGNMFGAFKFVAEAQKQGVIPVVGCEFYVVKDMYRHSFTKGDRDRRFHQLMLAKNQKGYENLSKLCSFGYTDGLYGKFPRIQKSLIKEYKEGLIATTCCIGAEVPQTILFEGEEKGEQVFKEWLDIFGEDYYIELQRHEIKNIDNTGMSQEDVNQILIKWSKKYNVPIIATNDSHYIDQEDANAHDILLCVNTGDKQSTPIGHGKDFRFGFPNNEFFFKTQAEMQRIFHDIPEALDNTNLIVDKITPPQLKRDILLPAYVLPENFKTQDDYLKYLAFEGAKKRYGEISARVEERLNFELNVIKQSGYPGYFLIVQDFTSVARELGVSVGPGRGSAAGSAVAYCTGITNVDPIKYDLLFERFLNPERISMPDIDIDFDDEGRSKVMDYVIDKYGKNQVAQIITYGSMAAKSSIRDVGRVLDLPLDQVNQICKTFPDHLSASLKKVLNAGDINPKLKAKLNSDQIAAAYEFRKLAEGKDLTAQTINTAKKLEGSVRNTGIHACGVIITPDDITKFVPVSVAKDSDLLVTQFDNSVVEDAGLLKMDFLGLKTLTIIKDAVAIIKEKKQIEIDPDNLPLDDEKTYQIFQKGETNGIFQFESPGMQKHLKSLKPNKFEDLIAMNALYRPGPMEYIPSFIRRKNGSEEVSYDLPIMEEYLKETYGITVYQEQVMLLSQKMAGFSKGQADTLRKAMGKKIIKMMDELFPKFVEGCQKNGLPKAKVEKVWKDWEAFASYAFNKSHSTCYAFIAYQTAYLKAHYPAEYMAAVLTHNMRDIKKVTFFMEEAKRMHIPVLGPDVNESKYKFTVNDKGAIRFGLGAIKGVGQAAVESIIENRENTKYNSIFDFSKRVDLRSVNKKTFESLALSGTFDLFEETHRAQYFFTNPNDNQNIIEKAIRYGNKIQAEKESAQQSLFGGIEGGTDILEPKIPECGEWGLFEKLQKEREVVGIFISGHPLDEYRLEIENFCTCPIRDLQKWGNREVSIAGMVGEVTRRVTKRGQNYALFQIEDYSESIQLALFSEDYLRLHHFLIPGNMLFIRGKMEESYRNPGGFDFKAKQMEMLQEVRPKLLTNINLSLNLDHLDENMFEDLKALRDKHPGKTPMYFEFLYEQEKIQLEMFSKTAKVEVNQDFLADLDQINLDYFFNNKRPKPLLEAPEEDFIADEFEELEMELM